MVMTLRLGSGLLHCALGALAAQTQHQSRLQEHPEEITATPVSPPVCDARTINHITHTLPQLCLARARQSASPYLTDISAPPILTSGDYPQASTEEPVGSVVSASTIDPSIDSNAPGSTETTTTVATATFASTTTSVDDVSEASDTVSSIEATRTEGGSSTSSSTPAVDMGENDDTAGSSYMSFEDWKEKMLRQTGQDPQALRSRKAAGSHGERRTPPQVGDYGLGEEDEISLDFGDYLNQAERSSHEVDEEAWRADKGDAMLYEGDIAPLHRSKDAGKTCKERFSYSSFDAGATILKTGRSTKNAKAILIENKDSYMLLECGADRKYVIVELSDDILIDTVVLANFEFFSSMIRQFRVSVSDRYPVKMEKWREIGTYEARNSRDIQAFLVENPQIWAKYVRIEFLTHYGNEFYCPVSLLRIHGSRILDSLKDMDSGREEDISIGEEEPVVIEDPGDETIPIVEPGGDDHGASEPPELELNFTPWVSSPLADTDMVCHETLAKEDSSPRQNENVRSEAGESGLPPADDAGADSVVLSGAKTRSRQENQDHPLSAKTNATTLAEDLRGTNPTQTSESKKANPALNSTISADSISSTAKATSTSSTQKLRGSGTSGPPGAAPTVQEGFFQIISKRLHHAETNLTLTMQYLEDHSKFVHESLEKAEQKQLSKVTAFLHNLNQTVLTELLGIRDQYDQIWQSTIIALETQKEQADRDIVALSTRLNLLADEVVFQKRMAIVQAILLLCCLFLVIFSRGVPIPYLAPLLDQNGANTWPAALHSHEHPRPLLTTENCQDIARSQGKGWSRGSRLAQHHPDSSLRMRPRPTEEHDEGKSGTSSINVNVGSSSTMARSSRLSPPLTPSLEVSDPISSTADLTIPAVAGETETSIRRSAYHVNGNQNRKPLPALPEHLPLDGYSIDYSTKGCK